MPRRCITVLPDNLQFRIGQRTADSPFIRTGFTVTHVKVKNMKILQNL